MGADELFAYRPEPRPWSPPLWDRPSEGCFGTAVPVGHVVGRAEAAALVLDQLRVHPNGFLIDLAVVYDPHLDVPGPLWQRVYGGTVPRVAVMFADGRRGDNLGQYGGPAVQLDARGYPTVPYVAWISTGGVGSAQVCRYWVYPLPPPGAVTISVSWDSTGIDRSEVVLDGNVLRAAAGRALQLYA